MEPDWTDALPQDWDPQSPLQAFTELLRDFLPMSQQELGDQLSVDRTTVNKWKNQRAFASIDQQLAVYSAIRDRIRAIEDQVAAAEEVTEALEGLQSRYQGHMSSLDEESLTRLTHARQELFEVTKRYRLVTERDT